MITVNCEQGSPEWFAARLGIPTASNFDKIVTSKGEPSKQAEDYAYTLAAERITGRMEESYSSKKMDQARELESEARALYELITDTQIQQVGVCYPSEAKLCAASPDGLVGEEGLIEIKCPLSKTSVRYLLKGELPVDYVQQAQGQLYVTGRMWLDFVSYYPGLKPFIKRIGRDEKFINALSTELAKFNQLLEEVTEKIK